ncbi:hypothetical protein BDZ89DRAFT_1056027, partial [Hymenopellis radicata]
MQTSESCNVTPRLYDVIQDIGIRGRPRTSATLESGQGAQQRQMNQHSLLVFRVNSKGALGWQEELSAPQYCKLRVFAENSHHRGRP